MATDHVTNVEFGQLVVRHIRDVIALLLQLSNQSLTLLYPPNLNSHKNFSFGLISVPIIEFGDAALAQGLAELPVGAGTLRNGNGQNSFALLTKFSALRNITQPLKIDVGATGNGDVGFPRHAMSSNIFLNTRHAHRTRRFRNGARIFEDILDARADFVVIHGDNFVNRFAQYAESFLPDLSHGNAIRKNPDIG